MKTPVHRRALTMLLTVVLLPTTALALFTPSYQTNDDVVMRLLAEGHFVPGGKPLPYLMFINVIIGRILTFSYSITTAVPWYDLVLGGSMIAASAVLVYTWLDAGRISDTIWTLLLAAYFLLPTFVVVQFSLAGLACSAAGAALIVRTFVTHLEPKSRQRHLVLGTATFFWGSLIRFPGAALMCIECAVLALPFIVGALRNADERPRLRGAFLAASAALLLTGVGFGVSQLAYRQAPGWKDFYEYNILRLRLAEYITPERITPELKARVAREIGWSANDFAMFSNWFFTDPDIFSLARVRRAERLFYGESSKPVRDLRTVRFKRALDLGKDLFRETRWAFLVMGVFVLAHGARPKLLIYFGGTTLTLAFLIVGISFALKAPPQRIFWPMLIMAATMLALAAQRWGRPTHWSVNAVAIVLVACVVAMTMPSLKKDSDARRVAAEVAQSDVEGLRRTGATMFVLHGSAFPYEDFWTPLHVRNAAFDFVGLGVSARTPPVQNFLKQTGRSDLPWSLCTDPTLVIIAKANVLPMLSTFVKEHHGTSVEFEEVFSDKRTRAWRCHRT